MKKNKTLVADDCEPLNVYSDGEICVSCWKPSFKDVLRIVFKRKVWLLVKSGITQPPLLLQTESPFNNKNK